jgi:hypothetical protein
MATPKANDQYATVEDYDTLVIEGGKMVRKKKEKKADAYQSNEAAFQAIFANAMPDGMMNYDAMKLVQMELRKSSKYIYALGLTKDLVVYEAYDESAGYYKTYQRTYEINDKGAVTLGEKAQEVVLTTQVLPVANSTAKGETPAANTESVMIEKTTPAAAAQATEQPKTNETSTSKEPKVLKSSSDQGDLEVNMDAEGNVTGFKLTPKAPAANAETPKLQTFADLLANADAGIREAIQEGQKLVAQKRDGIIKALKESGRCKFSDDALKAMNLENLENLAQLAAVPTYAGQALPKANATDDDAPPAAPNVFEFPAPKDKTA